MEKTIVTALKDDFLPFASDSLINFLPSVGDGLLPVHRKVIYAMYRNGVTHEKSYIKMLRASAMAMTYYVYGDMPLTKAMKNMGNNTLNYMYLDPKGSFGDKQKKVGVGSSPRYIECKLSEYSEDMVKGIKRGSVPMKRNFDNTEDEPIVLPSLMPNVLLNTSQSIAVGEASKIPAHNLVEVCDSFISYLQDRKIDKAISYLHGCDLSLGGQIVENRAEFNKIYKTGKGSFTLVGKYEYDKQENKVVITEVPYETYIEAIEEKLRQQYEKGLFKEVVDIHDGSDKDGLSLDIYLKKNTDIDQFISKLRKHTPFECQMSCNFTLLDIDCKTPVLMSLEQIIVKWTEHRRQCLKRELEYDIRQLTIEQTKLQGLAIILQDLDKAITIIRGSKSEKEAMLKLISEFGLLEEQAEYISTIRLINMNNEWLTNRANKLAEIGSQLEILNSNLNNDNYYKDTITSQLEYVKSKYGKPRQTEVITLEETKPISKVDLIEEYNCYITLTQEGYIKKTKLSSDNHKMKDGDFVSQQLASTNKSNILLFTNKTNMYTIKGHQLDLSTPSTLGTYLANLLELEKDEKVIYMVSTLNYEGNMLFGYANGKVAKITLSAYKSTRKLTTKVYNTESELIHISLSEEKAMYARSSIDKVLVFDPATINPKSSKSSQGVNVLKSKEGSTMIAMNYYNGDKDVTYYTGKCGNIGTFIRKEDIGLFN